MNKLKTLIKTIVNANKIKTIFWNKWHNFAIWQWCMFL